MAGGGEQKSLEQTPTWAVAAVCTVFVVASLLVERVLKYMGNYLRRTKQKQLLHTLEQIKDELMLLGFISLSLTVFQSKIASICMPERLNSFMLPCKYRAVVEAAAAAPAEAGAHRRLLASGETVSCPAGKVQVISAEGLHQLHIFIFVMAIVHVVYSALTVIVGLWQVHRWKKWEIQATADEDKCFNKAFVTCRMRHSCLQTTKSGFVFHGYPYSFFRQFGKPIYKSDYLCLRLGFIEHHQLKPTFDFHSYIKRSMERDFQHVVGISGYLWAFVCIYLLVDINGWYSYFWLAFVPSIMVLFVGAKLQLIITCLAREVRTNVEINPICKDMQLCKKRDLKKMASVHPRDELFWFSSPRLLLFLVHFILFQNAFELAFFFWTLFTYGYSSCLVGSTWMVIVRILVGFSVQILCSASTLPLYALVTQLGSNIKYSVFQSESTGAALKGWARAAKKKHNEPNHVHTPPGTPHDSSHDSSSQDSKSRLHTPPVTPHDSKPHVGILGINKALDAHGHPVDIPLGTKLRNGHNHGNSHPAHPKTHDGSHTVEIGEQPAAAPNGSTT